MAKSLKEFVRTDLVQAKILNQREELSYFKLFFLFFRFRTCRIHLFVRLRRSNIIFATIAKIYLDRFFIEIGNQTEIDKYFYMPHPRCIIIANNVKLGKHIHVGQYVTIGGNYKKTKSIENGETQKLPIIGNNVNISPGVVIGGPVTIQNNVIVAANAVITHDVPGNSIMYGQNQMAKKKIVLNVDGGSYSEI